MAGSPLTSRMSVLMLLLGMFIGASVVHLLTFESADAQRPPRIILVKETVPPCPTQQQALATTTAALSVKPSGSNTSTTTTAAASHTDSQPAHIRLSATEPLTMGSLNIPQDPIVKAENGCPMGMTEGEMLGHQQHNEVTGVLADVPASVPARTVPLRSQKIPYTIMQNNKDDRVPIGMWHAMHSVLAHNPEYAFEYYSDQRMRGFIAAHMDRRTLEAYDKLRPGAFKSDLFRYCWLWAKGGVYVDSDMTALTNLAPFIPADVEFLSPEDNGHGFLYNAFLATTPHHPIIGAALNLSVARIMESWYGHVLAITGPVLLGEAFEQIVGRRPARRTSYLSNTVRVEEYGRSGHCGAGLVRNDVIDAFITAYPAYRSEMKWYHTGQNYWDYVYSRTVYVEDSQLVRGCPFGDENRNGMHSRDAPAHLIDHSVMLSDVASFTPARQFRPAGASGPAIPRRILIAAPTDRVPPGLRAAINTVIEMNPDHDVEFYSLRSASEFVRLHCRNASKPFAALRSPLMQLELFRYCWLAVRGGVSVLPETTAFTGISKFLRADADSLVAYDDSVKLPSDAILGCAPQHPIAVNALALACERIAARDSGVEIGHVTGRVLLQRVLESTTPAQRLRYAKKDTCASGVVYVEDEGKPIMFRGYKKSFAELGWYYPAPLPKDAFAAATIFV